VLDVLPGAVEVGTGKVAATLQLTRALAKRTPTAVIPIGVCGAYPAAHGPGARALAVGDLCWIIADTLADEGVEDETGFRDLAAMGLGDVGPFHADASLVEKVTRVVPDLPQVTGATVSTCSGTDARSLALARRTGAVVETMEGAAIARVCHAFGVPWIGLRCISNRCGDRAAAGWDLAGAVARLHEVVRMLAAGLAE
jgi:futalosine hydrolase